MSSMFHQFGLSSGPCPPLPAYIDSKDTFYLFLIPRILHSRSPSVDRAALVWAEDPSVGGESACLERLLV